MAPRAKVAGSLVGLTASDSEPDFDDVLEAQPALSTQPVKRPRGRPPTSSKVTKPAQKQVRSNSLRPTPKAQASPRRALADKARNTAVARPPRADKPGPLTNDDTPMREANLSSPMKPAETARGKPKAMKDSKLPAEHGKDETSLTDSEPTPIETEQYQMLDIEEDVSDPTVRRKLGDLARKYESLEARHREMRQVGIVEADRNFEKLQKQADESAAAASKLINELKAELAKQSALARKGEETRKQLERSETRCESLKADVADISESLAEANSQIKTLSTKLAAFRSTEATVTVPGSALKAGAAGNRAVPADVVQAAQAKEDLYGDLTGLILRGVSLGKEEDVFDCIQTGRNGTLHFKLALDKVDNYDDVQVTYRPQLDESRDEELIDLLPDYLVEEISFARSYAAKFYSKVVKTLTE